MLDYIRLFIFKRISRYLLGTHKNTALNISMYLLPNTVIIMQHYNEPINMLYVIHKTKKTRLLLQFDDNGTICCIPIIY